MHMILNRRTITASLAATTNTGISAEWAMHFQSHPFCENLWSCIVYMLEDNEKYLENASISLPFGG